MPKKKLAPIHIKRRFHILPWTGKGYSNSCYIQTAYIWLKANGYIDKAKEKLKSYTKDGKIDFEKYYQEFVEAKEKEIKEIEDKYPEIFNANNKDMLITEINNYIGSYNEKTNNYNINELKECFKKIHPQTEKRKCFLEDIHKRRDIRDKLNEIKGCNSIGNGGVDTFKDELVQQKNNVFYNAIIDYDKKGNAESLKEMIKKYNDNNPITFQEFQFENRDNELSEFFNDLDYEEQLANFDWYIKENNTTIQRSCRDFINYFITIFLPEDLIEYEKKYFETGVRGAMQAANNTGQISKYSYNRIKGIKDFNNLPNVLVEYSNFGSGTSGHYIAYVKTNEQVDWVGDARYEVFDSEKPNIKKNITLKALLEKDGVKLDQVKISKKFLPPINKDNKSKEIVNKVENVEQNKNISKQLQGNKQKKDNINRMKKDNLFPDIFNIYDYNKHINRIRNARNRNNIHGLNLLPPIKNIYNN